MSYRPRKNQGKQDHGRKMNLQKSVDMLEEREELLRYGTSQENIEEVNEDSKIIAISSNKKIMRS